MLFSSNPFVINPYPSAYSSLSGYYKPSSSPLIKKLPILSQTQQDTITLTSMPPAGTEDDVYKQDEYQAINLSPDAAAYLQRPMNEAEKKLLEDYRKKNPFMIGLLEMPPTSTPDPIFPPDVQAQLKKNFAAKQDFITREFQKIGVLPQNIHKLDNGFFFFVIPGTAGYDNQPPTIILVHEDKVPGDPAAPLKKTELQLHIIGKHHLLTNTDNTLGLDDAAGIVNTVNAIKILKEEGRAHGPLIVGIQPDEEREAKSLEGFFAALRQDPKLREAKNVLVKDTSLPKAIVISQRGIIALNYTIKGLPGAYPAKDGSYRIMNATEAWADLLYRLRESGLNTGVIAYDQTGKETASMNWGRISDAGALLGQTHNTIPGTVRIYGLVQSPSQDTRQHILAEISRRAQTLRNALKEERKQPDSFQITVEPLQTSQPDMTAFALNVGPTRDGHSSRAGEPEFLNAIDVLVLLLHQLKEEGITSSTRVPDPVNPQGQASFLWRDTLVPAATNDSQPIVISGSIRDDVQAEPDVPKHLQRLTVIGNLFAEDIRNKFNVPPDFGMTLTDNRNLPPYCIEDTDSPFIRAVRYGISKNYNIKEEDVPLIKRKSASSAGRVAQEVNGKGEHFQPVGIGDPLGYIHTKKEIGELNDPNDPRALADMLEYMATHAQQGNGNQRMY